MSEKRYYKAGEQVWSNTEKAVAVVKDIDTVNHKMNAYVTDETGTYVISGFFWEFDKLRGENKYADGSIGFAKFRPTATIPVKNHFEDAGYDVYLDFPKDHKHAVNGVEKNSWTGDVLAVHIQKGHPTLLPTGIGVKVSSDYYTDWANERGSTGLQGMLTLSGVVDSGYRGEVFLDIAPTNKDVIITNQVKSIVEKDDLIFFPVTKAVAQMIVRKNYHMREYVMSLEDFQNDNTNRGDSKLGESGK